MRLKSFLIITLCLVIAALATMPTLAYNDISDRAGRPQQDFYTPVYIRSHRVDVEISNQIARTRVTQVFVNEGSTPAEGTYIFPIPQGITISDLIMYIDGQPIQAQILEKDEARRIYDEIVRQLRDPALLEYVGSNAIQANVFPIPPNDERTLEIEYSQILTVDNGLINYVYPLRTKHLSPLPVGELSIRVSVESNDPISNIYSPTHRIAIDQSGDKSFVAGFETSNTYQQSDFSLYYGLASDEINLNLLTYRESAREDGFFVVLVAPPAEVAEDRIIPKDVIVVLDQSGSMYGAKWDQARDAAKYVLNNLNRADRFNMIVFSTGTRVYAANMQSRDAADDAKDWLDTLEAVGGTNINEALLEALEFGDSDRQTVILFLTDGLATEGETDTATILENVADRANENTRIFTFGVGDDVDTFLLDQLSQTYRGVSAYVRPDEDIEADVSGLYNKISAPVLTDLALEIDGVDIYDVYPDQENLPDLFIGTQLVITGRYQGDSANASLSLSGKLENERMTFTYRDLSFRANAGGESLIARLWATRRIGELLNAIRLQGENPELVDSIVRLSIRYGIITPYTSFLITEDDILSQQGREEAVFNVQVEAAELDEAASGASAVDAAESARDLADASAPLEPPSFANSEDGFDGQFSEAEAGQFGYNGYLEPIQFVGDRTFIWRDGVWLDTTYNPDEMTPEEIVFLSDAYFALLDQDERVAEFYAVGEQVIFVLDGQAYAVVLE